MPDSVKRNLDSQNNVTMEIDLKDLLGVDELNDRTDLRQAIGAEVIERIVDRAESGKFSGNKKYSDEYEDTLEFKAFGKSPGKADMTLTGSMLSSITVRETSKNKVIVGWPKDSLDGKKAHGHITGDGTAPQRDFFYLTNKDVSEIRSEYKDDFKVPEPPSSENAQDILDFLLQASSIRDIFGGG